MTGWLKRNWRRVLINAFILVHVYIMAVWGLPGSAFRYVFSQPVTRYVLESGLWHSWDMFSPDPLALNFNVEAVITFRDGTVKSWVFPRMEKLGCWQRFQKERYRKWRERVRLDMFAMVWDDTARYIARVHDTPGNPPVQVTLIRHWEPIPAPVLRPRRSGFRDDQPMIGDPAFPFSYRFKQYDVQPEDL